MNREIKFRAYSKRKEKIENVVGLDWLDSGTFKANVTKSSEWYEPHLNGTFDGKEVEEFVLMQFTGLKDKNGKEIYEGDILKYVSKYPDLSYQGIQETYVVEWKERGFVGRWLQGNTEFNWNDGLSESERDMEVIGNVFENPSLINK